MVREGHSKKEPFKLAIGRSGRTASGSRTCKCKGPGVKINSILEDQKEASVAGT